MSVLAIVLFIKLQQSAYNYPSVVRNMPYDKTINEISKQKHAK